MPGLRRCRLRSLLTNARTLRVIAVLAGLVMVAIGIDIVKRGASAAHAGVSTAVLVVGGWFARQRKGGGDVAP